MTNREIAVVLALFLALAGCAHKKRARAVPSPLPVGAFTRGYSETGMASWYGNPYHGRPTANGEIYDMDKMTAAHRTLPFNTWVRVYDLDNQKTTEVRVIDRGPFIDGRIIDLSRAAARNIDLIGPGTARVRIEVIRTPETATPALFAVQVGAFQNRANADRLRAQMESSFGAARVVSRPGSPTLWRVLVGAEATQEGANALAVRIRQNSNTRNPCLVVRIDPI